MAVVNALETERLRGARLQPGDFADYFSLFRDPRVTATLTADGQPLPEEEARRWFARKLEGWERDGYGLWLFRDRATGRFVGYCGLQPSRHGATPTVELLYAALPEVVSYALPTNRASQRVMEKQGFRYERDIIHAGLPHRFYRVTSNEG